MNPRVKDNLEDTFLQCLPWCRIPCHFPYGLAIWKYNKSPLSPLISINP